MKHLFVLLLVSTAIHAPAQTYPEPDFANVPMWYDGTVLKSFERATPNQGSRITGMASAEVLIFFAGETSNVQFPHGKVPPIIFKTNGTNDDPAGEIDFGKLQVNKRKHQREYITGKGGFGGSKTTVTTLSVDFKKINPGVYQVVPSQTLEPGEYCFNVGRKAFCFSILDSETHGSIKEKPHPHDPLGEAIYRAIQKKKAKEDAENKTVTN